MLKIDPDGIYRSTLLTINNKVLIHGFSSRRSGDMLVPKNRQKFLQILGIEGKLFVTAEQVHGAKVDHILVNQGDQVVGGVDGLVSSSGISLGVKSADCAPILFVDLQTKIVGAAHAGWRGTLGKVAVNVINKMILLGAQARNILVAIGPHIGMCCYHVPNERADKFRQEFGSEQGVVGMFAGRVHLNLAVANVLQLVKAGIMANHIDRHPICTSCRIGEFFSYRRDDPKSYGEMLSVVGIRV